MTEKRFSAEDSEIVAHFDCATTGCAVVEVSISCGFPPLYSNGITQPIAQTPRVHPLAMRPPACPGCGCVMEYSGFTARELAE